MCRFALKKLPAPDLSNKFSVSRRHLAAHRHDMWPSLYRHAFEGIVVHIHCLRFRRNGPSVFWIVNDHIRIAPQLNRPLPRKESEELGRLSACGIHETVQIQPALFYSISE